MAPRLLIRRQTVARNLLGSDGTRYTSSSQRPGGREALLVSDGSCVAWAGGRELPGTELAGTPSLSQVTGARAASPAELRSRVSGSLAGPDQAVLVGVDDCLHPVAQPELGENPSDMRFHCRF